MGVGRRSPCTQCHFSVWRPRRSPDLLMPFLSTNPQRRSAIAEQAVFISSRSYPCWHCRRVRNASITSLGLNSFPLSDSRSRCTVCTSQFLFLSMSGCSRATSPPPRNKKHSKSNALRECPAPKRADQLCIRGSRNWSITEFGSGPPPAAADQKS